MGKSAPAPDEFAYQLCSGRWQVGREPRRDRGVVVRRAPPTACTHAQSRPNNMPQRVAQIIAAKWSAIDRMPMVAGHDPDLYPRGRAWHESLCPPPTSSGQGFVPKVTLPLREEFCRQVRLCAGRTARSQPEQPCSRNRIQADMAQVQRVPRDRGADSTCNPCHGRESSGADVPGLAWPTRLRIAELGGAGTPLVYAPPRPDGSPFGIVVADLRGPCASDPILLFVPSVLPILALLAHPPASLRRSPCRFHSWPDRALRCEKEALALVIVCFGWSPGAPSAMGGGAVRGHFRDRILACAWQVGKLMRRDWCSIQLVGPPVGFAQGSLAHAIIVVMLQEQCKCGCAGSHDGAFRRARRGGGPACGKTLRAEPVSLYCERR